MLQHTLPPSGDGSYHHFVIHAVHPAVLPQHELLKQCTLRRQRRSGPGGQHRNKVETAIFIQHTPTGVTAEGSERRSQEANRQNAILRLRVNLAIEVRGDVEQDAPPSELWQSRTRSGKLPISIEHEDFPAMLAEALDHVQSRGSNVKAAAEGLQCSTSQLIKFLSKEPRALQLVNAMRLKLELKPLRT